jgi:hypothetical protein
MDYKDRSKFNGICQDVIIESAKKIQNLEDAKETMSRESYHTEIMIQYARQLACYEVMDRLYVCETESS